MKRLVLALATLGMCFNLFAQAKPKEEVKKYNDIVIKLALIKNSAEDMVKDAKSNWAVKNILKPDTTKDQVKMVNEQLLSLKKQYSILKGKSAQIITYQKAVIENPWSFLKKKTHRKKLAKLLNSYITEHNKLVLLFNTNDRNYNANKLDIVATVTLIATITKTVYDLVIKLTEEQRNAKVKLLEKQQLVAWSDIKVTKATKTAKN